MKYCTFLLVLLVCSLSYGQKDYPDYTRVTAYRLIQEDADGPCSIVTYMTSEDFNRSSVISAVSSDKTMMRTITDFVKKTKRNKKTDFYCSNRCIGCDVVDCIFVLEGRTENDTLFFSNQKKFLLIPKKEEPGYFNAYGYKSADFNACLNIHFYDFFIRDFMDERWNVNLGKSDSVPLSKILCRNKDIRSISKKEIISDKEFSLTKADTFYSGEDDRLLSEVLTNYKSTEAEVAFENDFLKEISSIAPHIITVDGITVGDAETLLKQRFPGSTQYPRYYSTTYEEILHTHEYAVSFDDNSGSVSFYITDAIITGINVSIYKPNQP